MDLGPIVEDDLTGFSSAEQDQFTAQWHSEELASALQPLDTGDDTVPVGSDSEGGEAPEEYTIMDVTSMNSDDDGTGTSFKMLDLEDELEDKDDITPGHWQQPRPAPMHAKQKVQGKLSKRPIPTYDRDTCCRSHSIWMFICLTKPSYSFCHSMCNSPT